VTRLGTYGDVTVRWLSTQVDDADNSEQVSVGSVRPPSGSITLTSGQQTAVFFVKVMSLILCK